MRRNGYKLIRKTLLDFVTKSHGLELVYHPSHGQNVVEVRHNSNTSFVYILASKVGWWSISAGVLKYIEEYGENWFIIFLLLVGTGPTADGWVLDKRAWQRMKDDLHPYKRDYKVRFNNLNKSEKISGVKAVAETLISHLR